MEGFVWEERHDVGKSAYAVDALITMASVSVFKALSGFSVLKLLVSYVSRGMRQHRVRSLR